MHTTRFFVIFFFLRQFTYEEVFHFISQVSANYLHEKYSKDSPFEYSITKNYM